MTAFLILVMQLPIVSHLNIVLPAWNILVVNNTSYFLTGNGNQFQSIVLDLELAQLWQFLYCIGVSKYHQFDVNNSN